MPKPGQKQNPGSYSLEMICPSQQVQPCFLPPTQVGGNPAPAESVICEGLEKALLLHAEACSETKTLATHVLFLSFGPK